MSPVETPIKKVPQCICVPIPINGIISRIGH